MTFKVKDGLSVNGNTILDGSGNLTTPAGSKATLSNTTAAGASLNLGTGTADPSSPATGDFWNNTGVLKIRQAAATKTVAFLDSTITGNAANVTGTVAIANGGTNSTATPTAGAVPYGTGTAFAFTAAGTAGQILTSNAAGAPTWQTLSSTSTNATFVAITDDVATATSQYLYFGSATSGNTAVKSSSSRLTFVPSTGNLSTIGSVAVGGVGQTTAGVIFSGSTSGTTTVKASAVAGTGIVITLPATTGNVVTTGDSGTVTSTMIADGTITNTDINASAAIAVSKLAANQISGVTLGSNLFSLTLGTGLVGTSYNGSAAVTTGLATSGVTAATYGSSTAIPVIAVDTYGRITSASNSTVTIGAGTLGAAVSTAGATATTVALNFSAAYSANTASNVTINPVVGPSITALATIMAAAPNGILFKTGVDTYGIATNAPTATTLATARTINTVSFNGSADIIVSTGGTGVTVTGTSIAIGQVVATSSNVQFNSIGVGTPASGTVGTITATSFNSITGLSSTTPSVASGTGAVGTGVTVARADHVHPVQTTVSGNAGTVTDGAYLSTANTFTNTNAFNGTGIHSFGNVITVVTVPLYTGYFTLGGRAIRKLTSGNAIQITDSAGTSTTHTFGDAGTLDCTGAVTGSSFNSITGLSSTTPVVAGTAAVGTGTTAARGDHVHPVQTTVSGLAGSATILATARTINGVSFDGSANITVADSTKLPLAGGTMTGNLYINNATPTVYLQDTDNMPAFLHNNSNIFYVLRHATANSTTWDTGPNGRHPMTLSLSTGDVTFSGNVTAYSDERLKKNIVPIANSLHKVSALNGVMFERLEGQKGTGLIAQNVQAVIPEAVTEDKDGYLSVSYGNLVGLLVEAIKELKQEIETLKSK
jgi:hypothetical protein